MKHATSMMAGLLLIGLIAGGGSETKLNAQSETGEIFTVPFAFAADGHMIQPGTYEVRHDFSRFLLSVQNVKTGEKQLLSVRPEERFSVPAKGLLVFERCGQRRELSEFHVRGTSLYSETTAQGRKKHTEVESCAEAGTVTLAAR